MRFRAEALRALEVGPSGVNARSRTRCDKRVSVRKFNSAAVVIELSRRVAAGPGCEAYSSASSSGSLVAEVVSDNRRTAA